MSDVNFDLEFELLKRDVKQLQSEAVRRHDTSELLRPIVNEQNAFRAEFRESQIKSEARFDKLTESIEKLAEVQVENKTQIKAILDDYHKGILEEAQKQQIWTWIKNNVPTALTLVVSGAAAMAIIRALVFGGLR